MSARPNATEGIANPELVARLGRGDERALRTLHRRYASLVFTVAVRFVDAAGAEEMCKTSS